MVTQYFILDIGRGKNLLILHIGYAHRKAGRRLEEFMRQVYQCSRHGTACYHLGEGIENAGDDAACNHVACGFRWLAERS
jgi:hypothetical protein